MTETAVTDWVVYEHSAQNSSSLRKSFLDTHQVHNKAPLVTDKVF